MTYTIFAIFLIVNTILSLKLSKGETKLTGIMFFIFGLLPWIVHVILTYFVANEVRFDDIYAYVIGISVIVFGISFLMNMVTYDISSVRFLKGDKAAEKEEAEQTLYNNLAAMNMVYPVFLMYILIGYTYVSL